MKLLPVLVIITTLFLCAVAGAVPTTGAATLIGTNNVTFTATGVSGTVGWFDYGTQPGAAWSGLGNLTQDGNGNINYTMIGLPLWGGQTYYFKACDVTGCGAELSFTMLAVTPIPTGTWGNIAQNITDNRFIPLNVIWNSVQAYSMPEVGGLTMLFGLLFAGVFIAMWLRVRGTATATPFAIIMTSLFLGSAGLLVVGLPPEFVQVGQAMLIISLAGTFVAWTFK